jgi:hypothetical protein
VQNYKEVGLVLGNVERMMLLRYATALLVGGMGYGFNERLGVGLERKNKEIGRQNNSIDIIFELT